MHYRFEFRPYQRPFRQPLQTSHGIWKIRQGIIIRLRDDNGRVGWGEIAPLPWFGSETLEEALDFCHQLGDEITTETIFYIPTKLRACQFGFESAWEDLEPQIHTDEHRCSGQNKLSYSSLLPAGERALQVWETLWNQGYRTFKWKIGVAPIKDEIKVFSQLIQALPTGGKLRLDANGGLSWEEAKAWLQVCELAGVEFLEQPLPVDRFDAMLELSHLYSTPIALDESVATLEQLQVCYQKGWRGIFVLKPAIAGSPKLLRQFCQQHQIDAVFSSVFETAIGRQAALKLAAELFPHNRALGFGINHWFNEDDQTCLGHLWKDH
ncbi:MAG: o-succinylbenzoate synthase [Aphanothece sp. CMT-3BRIN-NPC111]|nr:o-succinylbenzoate synthase [Aphanothece sp. CMT-3BRIN-NPC111]